jgi:membrane associated rhomboid family serine protease
MLPVRDRLPTRSVPVVNYLLIAGNVSAFVWESGVSEQAVETWTLVPAHAAAHPLTLVTHMFLHAGLGHVAGNMLFLWIFGDNVEDALGHVRYAVFYLLCGLAAAFAQIVMGPFSTVPVLGASGAIAGVLAAYGFLYPRSPITVINPVPFLWLFWGLFIYLPAWVVILEFFLVNLWDALQPQNSLGGVAFAAHVGGFVAGAALLRVLRPEPVDHARWERWVSPRKAR